MHLFITLKESNATFLYTYVRAKRLEKLLDTPARIYYKYEGVSPAGSHKPNSAVPQVWYNAQEGVKNVVTETGAGQWGCSLAFACSIFGIGCEVRINSCKTFSIFDSIVMKSTNKDKQKSVNNRKSIQRFTWFTNCMVGNYVHRQREKGLLLERIV